MIIDKTMRYADSLFIRFFKVASCILKYVVVSSSEYPFQLSIMLESIIFVSCELILSIRNLLQARLDLELLMDLSIVLNLSICFYI